MSVREKIREKYKGKPAPKNKNDDRTIDNLATPAKEISPESIADLRPSGYNPRTITAEQQKMLQESMKVYGDLGGIVFNHTTGRLIGGHQRSKMLDPNWQITKEPQTDSTGTIAIGYALTPYGKFSYREVAWPEDKEKAANIAANKMGGVFEDETLALLLKDLYDQDSEYLNLTGHDQNELEELLGLNEKEKLGKEDPEVLPVEDPFVKLGDLWVLGENRLLCGDSTSIADLDKLMMGEKADLVWTDPPYNVKYESKAGKIKNDNMSPEAFKEFLLSVFSVMHYALKPGGCFYIAHAEGNNIGDVFRSAVNGIKGLLMKQCIIWVKDCAVLGRQDYNWKHEPILYGWKEGAGHYFNGDFTQTTVIDDAPDISKMDKKQLQACITEMRNREVSSVIRIQKPAKSEWHPTIKPVKLVERNVYASSLPGEIVLDLFNGSGTTIITCRKTGRRGRGMELDPRYAEATLKRYMEYCGEEPMLMGADGKMTPFSEVEKQRKANA
ncbi:DNA modification methylase [Oryzomonas rubra]|nr:DNA modification methylase [Oryzomonas rubra]